MPGQQEVAEKIKLGSIVRITEGIHKEKLAKITNLSPINSSILGQETEENELNQIIEIELLFSLTIIKIKRKRLNLVKDHN